MSRAYIRRAEPFSPTSISGCQLWMDAMDTSSMTFSGPNVTVWRDKSGNGRNATGGVSPTFATNGITFNGTSQYLATTYSSVPLSESVFVVVTWTGTTNRFYCIIGTSETLGRNYNVLKQSSGINSITWDRWAVGNYAPTPGIIADVRFMSSGIYNGSTGTTGLNGGAQSTAAAFAFSGNGITHIGTGVLGDWFTGTIHEIILYNTALITTQREQVEGYLAQKWGLRNQLSQTHAGFINVLYPVSIRPTMAPRGYFTQFSPTSVAGCQVWLDGADTSSMTFSGSNVTQWNDKSGKAFNATTPAGTVSPPYLPATREVQFVETNSNVLRIAQGFGDALVGTTHSIFFIGRRTVASGYHFFLASTANLSSGIMLMIGFRDNNMSTNTYGPEFNSSIPSYTSPDPVRLYCYEVQSSSLGTHILNGTQIGSSSQNFTLSSFANPELGRRYGSAFHTFNLSEMIAFSPALTTTQRQQVESYLAQKWDLSSSLPAGHLNTTQPVGYPTPGTALKRSMVPLDIPIVATGGTTSIINGRKYHYFLSDGTFTINTTVSVEIFLIGGGAGGSSGTYTCAGGGAGGLVLQTINLRSGSYAITVGQGGGSGSSGGNSVMAGVATAFGGGSGNSSGGCGGGQTVNGGGPGAGSQGFAGGPAQGGSYNGYNNFNGGGGGGVRGAGGIGGGYTIEGLPNTSSGGMGITYSDGSSYGGGGSGGSIASGTTSAANGFGGGAGAFWSGSPTAGTNGTGGGGGGGSQNSGGASGGHGIVILSYIPVP